MKKVKPVVARTAKELADVLGLTPAAGLEIEIRSDLNDKIAAQRRLFGCRRIFAEPRAGRSFPFDPDAW